ncbi:hypothetical protein ACVWYN_002499 [Pedobacter sp. UYP24]
MKQILQYLLLIAFLLSFAAKGQDAKTYKFKKQAPNQFTISGKIDSRDAGRINRW